MAGTGARGAQLCLITGLALARALEFAECPRMDASALSAEAFWDLMSRDPRPRLLVGAPISVDFVARFGGRRVPGGAEFDGLPPVDASTPYRLVNPPAGTVGGIYRELRASYPLPAALGPDAYDLCPMVSIGRHGTGQTDIARHYHSNTALLLLEGEKIWALRPPSDGECAVQAGDCTDPLDVCAFYARAGAPPPACVQRPGEATDVTDATDVIDVTDVTAGNGVRPSARRGPLVRLHPVTCGYVCAGRAPLVLPDVPCGYLPVTCGYLHARRDARAA